MKAKYIVTLIILCIVTTSFSQKSINDYKYVIVEHQFHFQNEANEYNLNEMTRFLFKKHGFRPILDSEVYPEDLKSNYCLALTSVITARGAFKTKVTIVLKDCDNNILFSAEGSTKEKEFSRVYNIGIRKAFEFFKSLNYKYVPNENVITKKEDSKDKVELLKAEIKTLKAEKKVKLVKIEKKIEDLKEVEMPIIEVEIEDELEDKIEEKPFVSQERAVVSLKVGSYFIAKTITNGFELLNNKSNKVKFTIYKTSLANIFIIKNKYGIIYKMGNKWVREYAIGDKTVKEFLDIRF